MFSRSLQLVKASYAVLRQDRELMLFPLLSTLGLIVVTIMFFVPLAATGIFDAVASSSDTQETALSDGQTMALFVVTFLFYLVSYTVIIFSNTALIGAALMRMRGEDPTVRDGFRIASEHLGSIIGYAAISATVGMILQALRGDEDNFVGQIVSSILGTAWNLITFLVIPVLVIENVGPIEAIKRSSSLLKRTWGENLVGTFGMGIIQFIAILAVLLVVGLPMYLLASAISATVITIFAIFVVVIAVAGVSIFFAALNAIFQAALYNYAAEGQTGEFFDPAFIQGAFHHK